MSAFSVMCAHAHNAPLIEFQINASMRIPCATDSDH